MLLEHLSGTPQVFDQLSTVPSIFLFWSNFGCRHNVEYNWLMAIHLVTISRIQPYNQPCPQMHLTPMEKAKCRLLCLGMGKSTSAESDFYHRPCTAVSLSHLNMCPFSFPLSFYTADVSSDPC